MGRLLLAFAIVGFVSPALAWGPFTHAALSTALLDKIAESRSVHPLAFLVEEPYRTLFVRSSLSPDMTLSAFAGKKVDPRYNRLFHDRAIGRALVQTSWDAHDLKAAAFALGWLGHAVSDNRMSHSGGSVIYRDLFGLPQPARKRLAGALNAINKVCLDAFILKEGQVGEVEPYIDEAALTAALRGPIAARKLDVADPETAIPGFKASFDWACSSLHSFCGQLAQTKAFPALIANLTDADEDGRSIPAFDEIVDAMDQSLAATVAAREPVAPENASDPAPAPSPAPSPGFTARAARKARALAASGSAFLWGGSTITKKLREALMERSIQLVNTLGGDGSLGSRLMITFAGDMLNETRSWDGVRAHIRKVAGGTTEQVAADE